MCSDAAFAVQGLTEEEAAEKLGDVDIYTSSFRPMKNTISGNAGRAFMKLVVDAETDVVRSEARHTISENSPPANAAGICGSWYARMGQAGV